MGRAPSLLSGCLGALLASVNAAGGGSSGGRGVEQLTDATHNSLLADEQCTVVATASLRPCLATSFPELAQATSLLKAAAAVFAEDPLVRFALLDLDVQTGSEGWLGRLRMHGSDSCDIAPLQAFRYTAPDNSCLLPLDFAMGARRKHGTPFQGGSRAAGSSEAPLGFPSALEDLVAFVNAECGLSLHRGTDGALDATGRRLRRVMDTLYNPPVKRGQDTTQVCEELDMMPSREVFLRDYVAQSRPVILRGAAKEWPAMERWGNQLLVDRLGDRNIHVKVGEHGIFEGAEDLSRWTAEGANAHTPDYVAERLQSPDRVIVRAATIDIPFAKFMALQSRSRTQAHNASFYVEYTSIKDHFPELLEDISAFPFAEDLQLSVANAWLGKGDTLGKLHFDPFENLLAVVRGSKTLTLLHPHSNANLYEGHVREGQLQFDVGSGRFRRKRLLDSTSLVMSPVDITDPNRHSNFPLFAGAEARALKCQVRKGDVLYMPAFWWHEVASSQPEADSKTEPEHEPEPGTAVAFDLPTFNSYDLPLDTSEPLHMAVNFWFKPVLTKQFPCPECLLAFNEDDYGHLLKDDLFNH